MTHEMQPLNTIMATLGCWRQPNVTYAYSVLSVLSLAHTRGRETTDVWRKDGQEFAVLIHVYPVRRVALVTFFGLK